MSQDKMREALESMLELFGNPQPEEYVDGGASYALARRVVKKAREALSVPQAAEASGGAAFCRETLQMVLDLLNPLHGSLDLQVTEQFTDERELDPPPDREYAVNVTWQMERDLTQAVTILENRIRYESPLAASPPPPEVNDELKAVDIIRRKGTDGEFEYSRETVALLIAAFASRASKAASPP